MDTVQNVVATEPDKVTGYRSFHLGSFAFSRDAYFVTIKWPAKGETRSHQIELPQYVGAVRVMLVAGDGAWHVNLGRGRPCLHDAGRE